ncbi:MAG: hypothetical protein IBJ16_01995 [Chitinophagaceae bacterium]|nr:hypothetical protein [Chitinophagaceae bacterium]
MPYAITQLPNEAAYRQLFLKTYCHPATIHTYDGIRVQFHQDMFNHCFFESQNRLIGDKSVFSLVRAERILWIRDTLMDPTSVLKQGWLKATKTYDNTRRVAIVQGDYVVVILLINPNLARFITAYKADNSIGKILQSPNWT